jgi:hypothetical protein
MTRIELKRALIAALLGACVTFFTHLLESFAGMDKSMIPSVAGGTATTAMYLRMTLQTYL